jgi:Protein of unknown function (DUF2911)
VASGDETDNSQEECQDDWQENAIKGVCPWSREEMVKMRKALVVLAVVALWTFASGQDKGKDGAESAGTATTDSLSVQVPVCTFADGKQLSVRYNRPPADRSEHFSMGKLWPPSNSMFLFTPVALTIGGSAIPPGAYSLYVIPEHNDWTLIVNKNVTEGAKYDDMQDLLRTPMKTGQLDQPAQAFTVYLAHLAPKQCNIRLYYGNTGSWAEFREQ